MSIRKKVRLSYRCKFGDLYMVIKKPMPKSKTAKRKRVLDRNWVKRNISKLAELIDESESN